MRKLFSFTQCSIAVAVCLGAISASAGFVSPRIPPAANAATDQTLTAQGITPNGLHNMRTVYTVHDDGPGSLRHAIASSAPGDHINFALRLPATIVLKKSLVIFNDITV